MLEWEVWMALGILLGFVPRARVVLNLAGKGGWRGERNVPGMQRTQLRARLLACRTEVDGAYQVGRGTVTARCHCEEVWSCVLGG